MQRATHAKRPTGVVAGRRWIVVDLSVHWRGDSRAERRSRPRSRSAVRRSGRWSRRRRRRWPSQCWRTFSWRRQSSKCRTHGITACDIAARTRWTPVSPGLETARRGRTPSTATSPAPPGRSAARGVRPASCALPPLGYSRSSRDLRKRSNVAPMRPASTSTSMPTTTIPSNAVCSGIMDGFTCPPVFQ